MFSGIKGPGESQKLDGSVLRVAIVHARWNATLIEPLVAGATSRLKALGVLPANIVITSVPGSWELPVAVQRLYAASQVQGATSGISGGGDLLGSATDLPSLAISGTGETGSSGDGSLLGATKASAGKKEGAFDAIIAIGVLIKGETMHFEHIAESVSRGLMRVQLDFGVPVVFGLLTVLDEDQAKKRAGLTEGGHNHGEDWGDAAVEMAVKRRQWGDGVIVSEA
ncbi:6,7-dimethyl-8-ribityllumazine synthase [Drechslerella stenobrocha 248]|uniref:6,7-dimethyl-8-ribityllumazine synthase n=1 Tax=Drechslerella stenobrocha 248 TaxID=1043628 RepID=W7HSL1_9PEZI|nr:6,7-dimethyl-8-ribityllumazine synthase [Drechslerella stenobrocha 248]